MEKSALKIFVTGASGLLGRRIMEELTCQKFHAVGIAFSRIQNNLIKCDLTKEGEVEKLIEDTKPDFIVHAAAERFPDKIEKDLESAKLLNVSTSRRLAGVARKCGSRIIYISTDYVFDGVSPPHKETDEPNPLNQYGLTKLEGEKAVRQANPDACVLRIPVLYGPVEKLEESAITCLLKTLLCDQQKKVSHYEKRYPSHTRDISKIICGLIRAMHDDPSLKGIFQWSGKECLTKYEMVTTMASAFDLPCEHIQPDSTPSVGAPRPYNALLDNTRVEKLGIASHTPFAEGVKECLQPWVLSATKES